MFWYNTRIFIISSNIVAMGEEYLIKYPNPYDDPYYKVPRLLGIARPLPRTNTLSTTVLIERILATSNNKNNSLLLKRNDDPTYNGSTSTTEGSSAATTTTTANGTTS
jgi:hypothetical protein